MTPSFSSPRFTQRDVVALTDADNMSVDAWVRHGHVEPHRVGDRRMFSLSDLVRIDLLNLLAGFKLAPSVAKLVVAKAWDDPDARGFAAAAWKRVEAGQAYTAEDQVQLTLNRTPDGAVSVEPSAGGEAGSFDLVLPVGTIADRVFSRVLAAGWKADDLLEGLTPPAAVEA